MNVLEYISQNRTYLDGGSGSLLQKAGLKPGEKPEMWNITHPEAIIGMGKSYFDAGSNIICSNTFGANSLKFDEADLEKIISSAIAHGKKARELSETRHEKFVALDVGPLGKMLEPFGDLSFEEAVSVFAKTIIIGEKYGADLIFIETMNDCFETKAALLAAKENSSLPVFVSNAYGKDGKLLSGTEPKAMIAMLEGLGADVIGINCSQGAEELKKVALEYLKYSSLPVLFKPNAGLPCIENGKTCYNSTPEAFSETMKQVAISGVCIMGGCCGTTPEYIRLTKEKTEAIPFVPVKKKNYTFVSSYINAVEISDDPVLIGERINPTGKKLFRQALIENNVSYILEQAAGQGEKGVHILDVNVGIPDIDEKKLLPMYIKEIQAVTSLPLQIDTSDTQALENALRVYNGKPLINSVNGKKESMAGVFPLVKKYGGTVIALTLDENGIPETARGRIEIAEKILRESEKYGIDKKDIVFDTLCMTVSTNQNAPAVTLEAIKGIKEKFGAKTCLGVSNVSFGLPERDNLNSTFFALALENGLNSAIMNPFSCDMMKVYYSYRVLHGFDENCRDYISFAQNGGEKEKPTAESEDNLEQVILQGLKEKAGRLTTELLKTCEPMEIVNKMIMPALNRAGMDFESKKMYLPSLLMCAESAGSAFSQIKKAVKEKGESTDEKCKVVIATVKGDIHDIGKNIVRLLLENYGFTVIDLGKDVEPEKILNTVLNEKANLVGLSALMTTTVPNMEKTISLLHEKAPFCKIIAGGAVLTREYSEKIGADFYGEDAMETVKICEKHYQSTIQ